MTLFGERGERGWAQELVDAAGERERPAAVNDAALDGDLELGGGDIGGGAGPELVVPVRAELRAPQTGGTAAGIVRAEGEGGEFARAQRGRAGVEIEAHRGQSSRISVWPP